VARLGLLLLPRHVDERPLHVVVDHLKQGHAFYCFGNDGQGLILTVRKSKWY
jgi:hypothetical protein